MCNSVALSYGLSFAYSFFNSMRSTGTSALFNISNVNTADNILFGVFFRVALHLFILMRILLYRSLCCGYFFLFTFDLFIYASLWMLKSYWFLALMFFSFLTFSCIGMNHIASFSFVTFTPPLTLIAGELKSLNRNVILCRLLF